MLKQISLANKQIFEINKVAFKNDDNLNNSIHFLS